ncbi:MAG: hypothetical protein EPN97_02480 [Alphaproteobacteria bacterium]|nr:MAG: hypothetical protein EPN97_02480 [Alphaproteobacteria bacterium]
MFTFLKKYLRRALLISTTLGLGVFMGPTVYEALHNENQQDHVETAMSKISQEQAFGCDPMAAGAMKDTRDKKLPEILYAAYGNLNPGWGQPFELFWSGTTRLSNGAPWAARFFSKHIRTLPEEMYNGHYSTALDDLQTYTNALASLGVGVCFDNNLTKINAGSAYTRDMGIITLNPDLSQGDMVEHAKRQLQRLNQELVLPYERTVKSGNDLTSTFNERVTALRTMTATLDGPVITLPLVNGVRADFVEVARKNYGPPLLTQPPVEQPKSAPVAPVKQPPKGPKAKG